MGEYWGYSWTFDFLPSAILCNGGSRLGDIFLVCLGFGPSVHVESETWHHPMAKLDPLGAYPSSPGSYWPCRPSLHPSGSLDTSHLMAFRPALPSARASIPLSPNTSTRGVVDLSSPWIKCPSFLGLPSLVKS